MALEWIRKLLLDSGEDNKPSVEQLTFKSVTTPARKMLKEAVTLKKEKIYNAAVIKLKEALEAEGASEFTIKERLRLPTYLQLANQNDEGWRVLNQMNIEYIDVYSQLEITNQMRIFLQKEKNHKQALLFLVLSICKEISQDRFCIHQIYESTDDFFQVLSKYGGPLDIETTVYGKTPKGNEISDHRYEVLKNRIMTNLSIEEVSNKIEPILKRLKKTEIKEKMAHEIVEYLNSTSSYDLRSLNLIIYPILDE